MGGDREVVMMAALITISSIAVGQNLVSAIFGIIFWFMVLIPSRRIAKKDYLMRTVLFSSFAFRQKYFPPHTHILANPKSNYKAVLTKTGMTYKG